MGSQFFSRVREVTAVPGAGPEPPEASPRLAAAEARAPPGGGGELGRAVPRWG